ncbi:hypothetical protein GOBAR_AA35344 [Gossypium barbadense]|uniref:Uncharacterized protein n=1 Tax=Gossypium barbadense TaxID=3634 RepID=A0A2P5W2N8_GOSBA|nr:hypothetical protein GOBAR_AA35344 [Gossypium barbadense]
MISAIQKKDEPKKEAKPVEGKTSSVSSMVLIPNKRNNRKGQKRSALLDTGTSDLFISEKAAKKLGLSIRKSNKNIKTVNSKEAPTVGVARNVELQIGEWKGKEDFEDSDKFISMGRRYPYCHWSVIKDCCASASGYEGWDQGVVVNPTNRRCFVCKKHYLDRMEGYKSPFRKVSGA